MSASCFGPGSTLGILGSGQLGRMLAIEARKLGYRVHVFSPDADTPAGQIADREYAAPYEDLDAVEAFAANVDVITLEFENIPAETAAACVKHAPVRPDPAVLYVTQNRLREKNRLAGLGIPVTPFREIRSADDLERATSELGRPSVLKSAGFGYDGKGQLRIQPATNLSDAWTKLGVDEAILEQFVDFEREVSVVAARGLDGTFSHFGVVENRHAHHILDVTLAPADVDPFLSQRAIQVAQTILEALEVVGVLCVEMFVTRSGDILVNELAPRPHNSGHFTIDACVTNQFEQQLRAVAGLPLGAPTQVRPAVMANLLGDIWNLDEADRVVRAPDWSRALEMPEVKLHLYGKREPRRGRKMGHLTALGATLAEAEARALDSRRALMSSTAKTR